MFHVLMPTQNQRSVIYKFDTYSQAYNFFRKWKYQGAALLKQSKKKLDNLDLFVDDCVSLARKKRKRRTKREMMVARGLLKPDNAGYYE